MFDLNRKAIKVLVLLVFGVICFQGIQQEVELFKWHRGLSDGKFGKPPLRTIGPHFGKVTPRPIIYTFFEAIDIKEDSALAAIDPPMLALWKDEWLNAGFQPRVLTLADAQRHPYFETMRTAVQAIFPDDVYNQFCFYRHLAMASVGGGWMSDIDTFPTNFPMKEGLVLPSNGKFTSYQAHVPALISASAKEWFRVSRLMTEEIPKSQQPLKSDMMILYDLRMQGTHNIDFRWIHSIGRPDAVWRKGHKIDCSVMNSSRAIHMSHQSLAMVLEAENYPIPTKEKNRLTDLERARGAREIMDQWRKQDKCGYVPAIE